MAWKRQNPQTGQAPSTRPIQPAPQAPAASPQRAGGSHSQRANIGKSVKIKGDVSASEDLTIDGTGDGKIHLKDHLLTIGANGCITNQVRAKSVVVAGEVTGNITADDKVEIACTGSMLGDISAPRVILADGARFKGSIDMEPKSARSGASVSRTSETAARGTSSPPPAALQRSASGADN